MSDIAYTDPSPRKQCDHICLGEYGHDSPHFYGYRSGTPVDEINRLIDEIERLRNGIEKYVTTVSDSYCTNAMERNALELLKETWRG